MNVFLLLLLIKNLKIYLNFRETYKVHIITNYLENIFIFLKKYMCQIYFIVMNFITLYTPSFCLGLFLNFSWSKEERGYLG